MQKHQMVEYAFVVVIMTFSRWIYGSLWLCRIKIHHHSGQHVSCNKSLVHLRENYLQRFKLVVVVFYTGDVVILVIIDSFNASNMWYIYIYIYCTCWSLHKNGFNVLVTFDKCFQKCMYTLNENFLRCDMRHMFEFYVNKTKLVFILFKVMLPAER